MTESTNLIPLMTEREITHLRSVLLAGMTCSVTLEEYDYANKLVLKADERLARFEHDRRYAHRRANDPAKFTIHREVL